MATSYFANASKTVPPFRFGGSGHQEIDGCADVRGRDHDSLEALAVVVANGLPISLIPKLRKAHERGVTLAALADAALLAHSKRLSKCSR